MNNTSYEFIADHYGENHACGCPIDFFDLRTKCCLRLWLYLIIPLFGWVTPALQAEQTFTTHVTASAGLTIAGDTDFSGLVWIGRLLEDSTAKGFKMDVFQDAQTYYEEVYHDGSYVTSSQWVEDGYYDTQSTWVSATKIRYIIKSGTTGDIITSYPVSGLHP